MRNEINELYARIWTIVPVAPGTDPDDIHAWCCEQESQYGYQLLYGREITERGELLEYVKGVKFQSKSDAAMFKLTFKATGDA